MLTSIHQRYDDDILIDASVIATPDPDTTYSASTLLTHRPADRVRWSSGTVHLRFHGLGGSSPGTSSRADLLVIPCWNVTDGTITLQSDSGMNVVLPAPAAMMPSGIPRTYAVDLTLLDTNATHRTSSGFDLIITGNSEDVVIGGAIMLYGPKRTFTDRDWRVGFTRSQTGFAVSHQNVYGTDLVSALQTKQRKLELSTICSADDASDLESFIDANFGNGLPGLLWMIPDVYEAMFGRVDATNSQQIKVGGVDDAVEVALTFTEISKGKPVA